MRKIIFLTVSILACYASFRVNADTLIINKASSVKIVIADKATETAKFAAEELKEALEKSLKCVPQIIPENKFQNTNMDIIFFVGPSQFTKSITDNTELKYDQFILKRIGPQIYMIGKDDEAPPLTNRFMARTGTLYAVYRFMNDNLGIRRIWPGESGEIIPAKNELKIQELDIKEAPAFPIRNSYYGSGNHYGDKSRKNLVKWGRFNGMGTSKLGTMGHSDSLTMGNKYFDEHPEYYALVKGKRKNLSKYGKICHSNPEVAKIVALWGVNHDEAGTFKFNDFFPVTANDGSSWCECEECLKLDAGQKGYSDVCVSGRMFTFANRVARYVKELKSPKKVAIAAYANYLEPPDNIEKMEDNIIIFIARGISWNAAPSEADKFNELFDKWSKKTTCIALRDYRDNTCPMVIYPYPHLAYKYIKYLVSKFKNFQGIDFCGDDTRATALWGPTAYVYAKMLWNPERKLEDILDEFYMTGWPDAHKYIQEYFEFFENRTYDIIKKENKYFCPYRGGDAILISRQICSPEAMKHGWELLETAQEAAKTEGEKERINFLKIGWQAVQNDYFYFESLMKVVSAGYFLHGIPPHPDMIEKQISENRKVQCLKDACDALEKRSLFLKKHSESEAIPSAPLSIQKPRFTDSWDNSVKNLLKLYNDKSIHVIEGPWQFHIDPDKKGFEEKWFDVGLDDEKWNKIFVNMPWENQGYGKEKYPESKGYDGWAWYRKKIKLPPLTQNYKGVILTLGAVDESYNLYINGKLAKEFRYNPSVNPSSWEEPQNIDITAFLDWGQENLIAVAVLDEGGAGGIWKECYYTIVKKSITSEKDIHADKQTSFSPIKIENSENIYKINTKDEAGSLQLSVKGIEKGMKYIMSVKISSPEKIEKVKKPSFFGFRVIFKDSANNVIPASTVHISFPSAASIMPDKWYTLSEILSPPANTKSANITFFIRRPELLMKELEFKEL
ncbi:MAG: hypothetical protein A2017_12410 [Lentisphaerae bacterium GWF2_44_16]|nr:MAG: hypothetical protein A2017_12410 [Lentisphaerae bacterium GWF2_44_16]